MVVNDKAEREAFVSGLGGSDVGTVFLSVAPTHLSFGLSRALRQLVCTQVENEIRRRHLCTLCDLVSPLISLVSLTLLAGRPAETSTALVAATLLSTVMASRSSRQTARSRIGSGEKDPSGSKLNLADKPPRFETFESSGRAALMVLTAVCILAVDFPVFPRYHAKTETTGTSLMDFGVGAFVCLGGLGASQSSAHSSSHDAQRKPGRTSAQTDNNRRRRFRRAARIALIGSLRAVAEATVNYQKHTSEYGTHWNFFFTLAFITVAIGPPLFPAFVLDSPALSTTVGLAIALAYQSALSIGGLSSYILYAPREGFVSANREGILGSIGFLALSLMASAHRLVFHTVTGGGSKGAMSRVARGAFAAVLLAGSAHAASVFVAPTSRRETNLAYCLWVLALHVYSYTLMLGSLTVADWAGGNGTPSNICGVPPDSVVCSTDRSMLMVFLLSNLLTGLVNLSMSTINCDDVTALAVLSVYMVATFLFPISFTRSSERSIIVNQENKEN